MEIKESWHVFLLPGIKRNKNVFQNQVEKEGGGELAFLPPFCSYSEWRLLTSSFTVGRTSAAACQDVDVDLERCQLHRDAVPLSDALR